jgi:hypothetical protein
VEPYQIQAILEMLIPATAVVMGLGILSWTWVKTRTAKHGSAEVARITDAVKQLQDRVDGMQEELGYVHERLDFTERVLTRVADDQGPGPRELPQH